MNKKIVIKKGLPVLKTGKDSNDKITLEERHEMVEMKQTLNHLAGNTMVMIEFLSANIPKNKWNAENYRRFNEAKKMVEKFKEKR